MLNKYTISGYRDKRSVGSIMDHAFEYEDASVGSSRPAERRFRETRFQRRMQLGAVCVALALSPIESYADLSPDPNPVGNTFTIGFDQTVYTRAESGSVNYGTIAVEAGGTLRNNNILVNQGGIIQLQPYTSTVAGGAFLNYGLFSNNSLGLLDVQGFVTNAGTFNNGLTNNATPYGTINVTGTGSIGNYTGGFISNFSGSSIFTGSSAFLYNEASWNNAGVLNLNGHFENAAGGVFNMTAPTGGSTAPSELINNSLITNNGQMNVAGGAQVTINAAATVVGSGTFTQTDATTKTIVNGSLSQQFIEILDGELCGTGSVTTPNPMVIGATAIVCPGLSPGTLHIVGDVTLEGIYRAEIENATLHDVLDINGVLELGADSVLDLHFGANTQIGDTFNILQASSISGSFRQVLFPAGYNGFVDISGDGLMVTVTDVSAVPVPPAVWLFGSGLLGLIGIARRKTAASRM